MTFREKLAQEHPEEVSEFWNGGCHNCPYSYGYEGEPDYYEYCCHTVCKDCWDREMPTESEAVEKEIKRMKIEVVKKQSVELEEFWVVRGVKDTGLNKKVVAELIMSNEPNELDIAQFLLDNPSADFCSVSHDYRLGKEN